MAATVSTPHLVPLDKTAQGKGVNKRMESSHQRWDLKKAILWRALPLYLPLKILELFISSIYKPVLHLAFKSKHKTYQMQINKLGHL